MGIKHLWNLLTPHCDKKPLFELNNKAVAIDLSGWVCESLNVVDYFVHPRFYLRNLFFRTCYLLQTGIIPVFVLEGAAPPLKYGVIIKRNQIQFRGARPKKTVSCDKENGGTSQNSQGKAATEQKRNRFHHVLKQCEELLSTMGLTCVQAPGEAEALCAYLNSDNLVYGVVSQDSDCFAYGAVRVFRNFCATQNGGSVDIYDLEKIRKVMDFGQQKIIAMGLFLGCDYCPEGVPGVGREAVNKLLNCYGSNEILKTIRTWRKTADRLTDLEVKVEDKNTCSDCGHHGKSIAHRRSGCQDCRTKSGCDESRWKNQRLQIKAELDIKRKSLQNPDFPSEAIIDEFLVRPCELPALDLKWKQPNLVKFIRNMGNLLQWDEIYCFQKLLPLFTRWQIITLSRSPAGKVSIMLEPNYIKKKRSPKGVASYEIIWKDENSLFTGLIGNEQIQSFLSVSGNTEEMLWSTIEPQDLVELAYPSLVESFLATKTKSKKKTAREKKRKEITEKIPSSNGKQTQLEQFLETINDEIGEIASCDSEVNELGSGIHLKSVTNPSEDVESDDDKDISYSVYLDRIANESPDDANDFDMSALIDRVCDPNYGKISTQQDIVEPRLGVEELLAMSVRIDDLDDHEEDTNVERRLLLKEDIVSHVTDVCDISVLNASSSRPRKRKSFFFEPLDIPPPELQDNFKEMDMFECSLMLKDRVVMPTVDQMNQTIVYDIDF
ncbi:flap endonuclease GEN-like [Toxorhynchites rutilus septentrionalis]|uniref:flap endonuclease GEN-like n=1 Tax=Toxorhynchites rutilus septentrionalis TaxID=329112 RepID=UPI002479E35A|nr:flap endonuclease GEN-like [Toxorhynchites rutilus septentrionalis]